MFYNTLNFAYQGISLWLTTTVPLLSSLYKLSGDVMLLTLFLSSSLSLILSCSWYLILCLSCSVSTISLRNLSRSFSLTTEKRMKIWWRHNEILLHYRIMTSQCKKNLSRKIEKNCVLIYPLSKSIPLIGPGRTCWDSAIRGSLDPYCRLLWPSSIFGLAIKIWIKICKVVLNKSIKNVHFWKKI